MANFKIGQQVVFVGGMPNDPDVINPKLFEICTIHSFKYHSGYNIEGVKLVGYLTAADGLSQSFYPEEIRAIDSVNRINFEVIKNFAPLPERIEQPIKTKKWQLIK